MGNPAVKNMSLHPPGMESQSHNQPARLALLNLPAQTGILDGHPAATASLRLGERQQAGLKRQEFDLHNKLLGAGFHLCTLLAKCHQWHCKRGATTVTTSEGVTSVLKRTRCVH